MPYPLPRPPHALDHTLCPRHPVLQGSATLSMAYAAALFADACLRGLNGQVATECAYVESSVEPDVPFFASRVKLSTEGAWGGCDARGAWPRHLRVLANTGEWCTLWAPQMTWGASPYMCVCVCVCVCGRCEHACMQECV
jgi:hypothetical protein